MNPSDSTEVAKLIASRMIERRDAKAIQSKNGGYRPARVSRESDELVPWKVSDIVDHLDGKITYGHYLVSNAGTCRMFAFDIDLRKKANPKLEEAPIMFGGEEIDPREVWAGPVSDARRDLALQLRCLTEGLAKATKKLFRDEVHVMASYSGCKGMHVYGCIPPGTPAADARDLARGVIDSMDGLIVPEHGNNFFRHVDQYQALSIEMFPKQDDVKADGFGNLIRLPMGVNQKSGKAGFFLDFSTDIRKTGIDNPLTALTEGSLR